MNSTENSPLQENILIVDDNPANLNLLSDILSSQGYKIRAALSGTVALKSVRLTPPDLILLDILMPEMDGYAVCQALKASPTTQDIPVIFISALNEVLDKVKAFSLGGVDYISKPFQAEEVLARVENQLRIQRLSKQLLEQNTRLQQELRERQRAEQALQASEQQLQLALEGSEEGWWDWNIATGEVSWSERLWQMLGYEVGELPGRFSTWERLIHPDDKPWVMELLHAHLQDSSVPYDFDYRFLTKSGEWKWIACYGKVVVRDELGKPLRMSGTHRDISTRKQAEEEREQLLLQIEYERARLEAVLLQMPAAIWIIEAPSGKVILHNDKVESVLGHPPRPSETLEDLSLYSAIHPDGSLYTFEEYPLARSLLTGEVVINEEMLYKKEDGSLAILSIYSSPIRDAKGQIIASMGAAFDITEQKQAQEQIQASLKEKEVLLKEIHHRVKNNLQIVKSLLQMQCRRTKEQEGLLVLQDSQNRIASIALVHEKLYRSEDLANIDFAQYIPDLTIHLFETYKVSSNTISLNVKVDHIYLEIDRAIPCSLIINELVSNSLKYAFPANRKGEIDVEFHTNPDDTLTLIVRDNGIGIPEEFDIETATSLGLTLVQGLVEQLEGTLELDRSQGSTFKITFAAQGK